MHMNSGTVLVSERDTSEWLELQEGAVQRDAHTCGSATVGGGGGAGGARGGGGGGGGGGTGMVTPQMSAETHTITTRGQKWSPWL